MNKFNATISADSAENLQVMAYRVANVVKQNEMVASADSLAFAQATEHGSLVIGVGGRLPAIPPKLSPQDDEVVPPTNASDEELHEFAGVLWRRVEREAHVYEAILIVDDGGSDNYAKGDVLSVCQVDDDGDVRVLGEEREYVPHKTYVVLEPVRIK